MQTKIRHLAGSYVLSFAHQLSQREPSCPVGLIRGKYMEKTCIDHINLDSFHVSEEYGFVLEKTATDLPEYYKVWIDLASNLTNLIHTHQLRDLVHKMAILSPHHLRGHQQLRPAHLALGFIVMGYVWQEGEYLPAQVLPEALALPFWLVSQKLGLPPILTYADLVLANWKLRDPTGGMDIVNLDLVFSFPGGESCRGFFLVSLLVEKAGGSGMQGAVEVMKAMATCDLIMLQKGLNKVAQALKEMMKMLKLMHNHVDPVIFHGTLRIFFSGWRDNPMLPKGLLYEGICEEPVQLSGGSAAQSSLIQSFDALLGVRHDDQANAFLKRMRDYMPVPHRQFVETLSSHPSLRDFILSCSTPVLSHAYDACVLELVELRSYHICIVARFITVPASQAQASHCPLRGVSKALDDTGTGGSKPMSFLKSVRDATRRMLISDM